MHRTGGMMKLRAGLVAHHRPVINKRQGEIQDGRRPRISRAGTEAQCGCERSPHWFRENAGRQLEETGQPRKYVTEGQVPDEPQRARCPMNHKGNRRTRQDRRRRYGLSIALEDPKVISIVMHEQVRDIRGGGDWHTPRHRDESSLGGESQVRKRRFRKFQASLTLP